MPESFETRERAMRELERIDEIAAPDRATLENDPSAELANRARELLERLESKSLSPAALRMLRGIEVLERAGTAEAIEVLHRLAKGDPAARQTKEAQAASGQTATSPAAQMATAKGNRSRFQIAVECIPSMHVPGVSPEGRTVSVHLPVHRKQTVVLPVAAEGSLCKGIARNGTLHPAGWPCGTASKGAGNPARIGDNESGPPRWSCRISSRQAGRVRA